MATLKPLLALPLQLVTSARPPEPEFQVSQGWWVGRAGYVIGGWAGGNKIKANSAQLVLKLGLSLGIIIFSCV